MTSVTLVVPFEQCPKYREQEEQLWSIMLIFTNCLVFPSTCYHNENTQGNKYNN